MKYIPFVVVGLVFLACEDHPSTGAPVESFPLAPQEVLPSEPGTGTVGQKAQFAEFSVVNLVGHVGVSPTPQILLTADFDPVTVLVYYVGDKTTTAGVRTPAAPVLVETVTLAADQTKVHVINTAHSAFSANHGCILVDTIDGTGPDTVQTHMQIGQDTWSVGGSVFTGGSYRIPYAPGIVRMILAITNQGDFAFDVKVYNVNGTQETTVHNLAPLSTWKFDSAVEGWPNLVGPGSVQITAMNGGAIAVSGYSTVGTTAKYRYYPVKAAPYP